MQDKQINIFHENCNIHIYNGDCDCGYEMIENEITECEECIEEDDHRKITPDGHCTICGKMLDDFDKQEEFGFDYHVGYGSKHDGDIIHARLCCDCFDKVFDIINDAAIFNPIVGYRD